MTAPQPPADDAPDDRPAHSAPREPAPRDPAAPATYDFHGEQLDFDPYRFGAPEPAPTTWTPPSLPGADSDPQQLAPGDRWNPGAGGPVAGGPEPRPGDYWQGAGSQRGDVFPPAGYTPPPAGDAPVDLGKQAPSPSAYPPPSGYPSPPAGHPQQGGYPPPTGYPAPGGHAPPGGYPRPPGATEADHHRGSNKIAAVGFGLSLLACVLFFTSIIALAIAGTGLGLSIAGLVKARKGAPLKGMAVWGVALSILAIVAAIGFIVYAVSQYDITCLSNLHGDTSRFAECRK